MDTYIKMCKEAKQLQKLWKPKVGDFVWRRYNFFNEEIDKRIWNKREEIIILTYASDVDGYFHATKNGETRIFNSHNEAHKATCVWLPTEEQLQGIAMTLGSLQGRVMQPFWELVDQFTYFLWDDKTRKYASKFESFNELWLAFVMKKKYHKIWDGKTWVKGT